MGVRTSGEHGCQFLWGNLDVTFLWLHLETFYEY